MVPRDFCEGWRYRHMNSAQEMQPVIVPHDAMLHEKRTENSAGGMNTGWYEGYDYLYEKRWTPDHAMAEKTAVLEFEGVYRNAEVSLNGECLMYRPYGYTNFYVDLTGKLRPGQENVLQVIAHNADQPNSRWYSGAGIYRPVILWTAEDEHIEMNGLRIETLSVSPPQVRVSVRTTAPGPVEVSIWDGDQEMAHICKDSDCVAEMVLDLPGAKLWSPHSPKLYLCHAKFGQDAAQAFFGVRFLEWGKEGLKLNGQRCLLQGACIHHDNGLLGACCFPDAVERKVRLLKENGYNAIRSAHNPCSKALLDACDRLGMLVMDEYIDQWYIHKTEYDYVDHFMTWWRQDLKDMVEKDYNHPCVILYSIGNEVSETAQKKGIELTKEMTAYLHRLDPTRPVTCGVNLFFNFLSSAGFGVYSDKKAKKYAETAQKQSRQGESSPQKKAVGSQFFNDLAGMLGAGFMKTGAMLPFCDWKTRDAFAQMDIAGYNYGIKRYARDLRRYPDRLILGSETFCSDAFRFREQALREPRLIGDFVWTGMDYLGEVGIGSWEYSDYAPSFSGLGWATAGSGRLDLTGKPLGEALYTKVALGMTAGPFLAVCPVNHTGDRHSPSAWKMTNALPSWSWRGCEGRKANIEIYARCATVALYLNGRLLQKKAMKKDCRFKFSCAYENGTLEAVAYDAQGQEIGRDSLITAGENTILSLKPEREHTTKGHLSFIRIAYTDEKGIVKPLERGQIRVTVTGGLLMALGHACPYNSDGYSSTMTDTYFGEALAIVMADGSGPVRVCAVNHSRRAEAVIELT